jgi:succinoglycan biosynthesis protein ExoL
MGVKIAYFAHDLSDHAVQRRMRMLLAGGAGGRADRVLPQRSTGKRGARDTGNRPRSDGRRQLAKRVVSVAGAWAELAAHLRGANVILARNLEMLVLAIRARKLYAPEATVVYECLDIHRTLLSDRLGGGLLRWLESKLWRDVDLVLTSSPAFVRNYFEPRKFPSPIRLVENKVLLVHDCEHRTSFVRPPPVPPWRISCFGMIRCRRSLEILSSLARAADGALEIIIRGRPSGARFPDFDAAIADLPHVRFAGPYSNPADLAEIYGEVHFNWAIVELVEALCQSSARHARICPGHARLDS